MCGQTGAACPGEPISRGKPKKASLTFANSISQRPPMHFRNVSPRHVARPSSMYLVSGFSKQAVFGYVFRIHCSKASNEVSEKSSFTRSSSGNIAKNSSNRTSMCATHISNLSLDEIVIVLLHARCGRHQEPARGLQTRSREIST